ncbi:hypothetical protein TVAG_140200 [Trichomonas vaginalis G3]|uniref:Right handed beta helix domain-containing protein n=1 Tax=Trichomonas vaginalis (strain ATCC PRA-98 / G3) TaxID=412133 RepID=A2F6G3_TRIV3|nr:protein ubiquitination [Trichomonas vaginalis G3]EAX99521.1 hypothetical protein TVAG_140200 [Trichomonas vaginalis G3]KAI5535669.1 protein ubiquitination [Trichomonas vaginalis G3]|eukprot:XP_001312451.1 hypothetical protein [Trichomonas vaginalis G3]
MTAPDFASFSFPEPPTFPGGGNQIRIDPAAKNPITAAIQKASPNSTIIVPAGEYFDNVVIDRPIEIIAEGQATIKAALAKDTFTVNDNCHIKGIQIVPGDSQATSTMKVNSGSVLIEECIMVTQMVPTLLIGPKASNVFIRKSTLQSEAVCGLRVQGSMALELSESQLVNTTGAGIMLTGNSKLHTFSSVIASCGDAGIVALESSSLYLDSTQISQCAGNGLELDTQGETTITQCLISACSYCGINALGATRGKIYNTSIEQCYGGISASEQYHVTLEGCQISNCSQDGALAAAIGATMELSGCVLQGSSTLGIQCNASQVTVTGCQLSSLTGAGITIVNGGNMTIDSTSIKDITENAIEVSNNSRLTMSNSSVENTDLIGLFVEGNSSVDVNTCSFSKCGVVSCHFIDSTQNSNFEKCTFVESNGNGFNIGKASPRFTECAFHASTFAGVEIKGQSTSPQFFACQFTGNKVVGVSVVEGASPYFDGCAFTTNLGSGITISKSACTVSQCALMNNSKMGLFAFDGANVQIEKSMFQENNNFGIQVQKKGTTVTVSECEIQKHQNSGGVILEEGCHLSMVRSSVHDNKAPNIEARRDARLEIEGSDISKSVGGNSIMIHEGGSGVINTSFIHDEEESGVLIGNNGNAEVTGCDISNCDVAAIYLLQGSDGNIHGNRIHDNKVSGVHIVTGSPKVVDNIIEDQAYGIYIESGAFPQISGNQFNRNSQTNVNRA